MGDRRASWDFLIPRAKFSNNNSINHSTPIEIIFGHIVPFFLDLSLIPSVGKEDADADFLSDYNMIVHQVVFEKLMIYLVDNRKPFSGPTGLSFQ